MRALRIYMYIYTPFEGLYTVPSQPVLSAWVLGKVHILDLKGLGFRV